VTATHLAPEFSRLDLVDLSAKSGKFSWRACDAIAIALASAATPETQPAIVSNSVVTEIEKELAISLTDLASSWPDRSGKPGEIIELPITPSSGSQVARIYLVGVGSAASEDLRKAGAALARKVKLTNAATAGKKILDLTIPATAEKGASLAHLVALSLASYQWSQKSERASKTAQNHFAVLTSAQQEFDRAQVLSSAVWRARDLIHTPANIKTPLWMANQAKKFVDGSSSSALTIEVLSGKAIAKFGGLTAVGGSSPKPGPRFIQVSYSPKGNSPKGNSPKGNKSLPHVVLVGKGITFDTGGISLKRPYDFMIGMKSDMAGSAAVLSTILAVAEIGAPVKVTALLMCAENAISSTAQRPSDVITQYGGTTVEIINTDAEGRLVLADGLAYADLELDPDYIVDIATLTGAATLGLGRGYGAMYTRDAKLAQQIHDIGNQIGERVWHMPLVDDYAIAMKSEIADLNHTAEKPDFSGGSVTAALFLENFVNKKSKAKWVHFDIAGPGRSEADAGENPKGGTGFGVRLLTQWIASLA